MKKNEKHYFEYKNFKTLIFFSEEDNVFCGSIENIKDIVCFHGRTLQETYQSFKDMVEDYINFCEKIGKDIDLLV